MKHLLLLATLFFTLALTAQEYTAQWEKVMQAEADGLTKTAASYTDTIYMLAKKDKNEPQLLKTFFFKSKYMQALEEEAVIKIITTIKQEIKTAAPPTAAFMESLYADMLSDLYYTNHYRLDQRTPVSNPTDDFTLWSGNDYKMQIMAAYKRSLKNRELLYNTPLEKYNAIIDFNPLSPKTGRSLYDFLAEQYINRNVNLFNDGYSLPINKNVKLFAAPEQFLKFKVPDSLSSTTKDKLALCQSMEAFYMAKKDNNSLYRSVLRRLDYANSVALLENGDYLDYNTRSNANLKILTQLSAQWGTNTFAYRAKLKLATLLNSLADKTTHPDYLKQAVALCNDIITNARSNDAAPEAQLLKNTIVNRRTNITCPEYVLPNQPILAKVDFKNTDTLALAIYQIDRTYFEYSRHNTYDKLTAGKKPYLQKSYILPQAGNNFGYETEIILPPLPQGFYLVTAHQNVTKNQRPNYTLVQATNITLLEQEAGNSTIYQVLNRRSGAPVKDAKITVGGKKTAPDKNGRLVIVAKDENIKKDRAGKIIPQNFDKDITVTHLGDTLNSDFYNDYDEDYDVKKTKDNNTDDEEIPARTQLYTDRAIYRPGQTMFFKGIIMQHKKNGYSVVPNIYVTVTIRDAAAKELKKFRLRANAFGSFSDQFTLPKTGLTGDFSITADEDEDYETDSLYSNRKDEHPFWDYVDLAAEMLNFRVEEYKRPTYDISFDPIKADTRLNQVATVSGKAKAYSGAPIQGAKVVYRVFRNASLSRYTYSRRYSNNGAGRVEIIAGETTTDADGSFKVTFTALPDETLPAKNLPVFTYSVFADVTDVAGETHSSVGSIRAGYHSLELEASLPKVINPKNSTSIILNSKNLNGQFMPVQGDVAIYKIVTQTGHYINRPWPEPEMQNITEAEFTKNFPYLPYVTADEDTIRCGAKLFTQHVNTQADKDIALKDYTSWQSGKYQLVFTAKDSANNVIENVSEFSLKKDDDTSLPDNKFLDSQIVNSNYAKDGYIALALRTALPLYVNTNAYSNTYFSTTTLVLPGQKVIVKIPFKGSVKKVQIYLDYVWQTQMFSDNFDEYIPENSIDDLKVEAATLSSKLQPGKAETWSFTIKGQNLPAEVLASMYDASLDKFTKHYWNLELPQEDDSDEHYVYLDTRENLAHGNTSFSFDNTPPLPDRYMYNYEQRLNTFGFNINQSYLFVKQKPKPEDKAKQEAALGDKTTVYGMVTDAHGAPFPFINVVVKNSGIGTNTDADGNYSIEANNGDELVFSFIGMVSKSAFADSTNINIQLDQEENMRLDEVVVVGYGTQTRKLNVTGSVITISSQTIEGRPNATFMQSLQSQIPGLNISTASGSPGSETSVIIRGLGTLNGVAQPLYVIDGVPLNLEEFRRIAGSDIESVSVLKDAAATSIYGNRGANGVIVVKTKQGVKEMEALQQVQARRNFNETAFFYPQLTTDKNGALNFSFTTPEALTEWKLRLLAHNKTAASAYLEKTFFTQKDLMVVPNMPRFLRESDTITIMAKVTNMTGDPKTGNALLQLFDAVTMQPVDAQMLNTASIKPFTIAAKGSTTVSWTIAVPVGLQGVQYKVLAKAGDFTDGEENILPVLTNNMLVTESLPLWVKPNTTKSYTLTNLNNNTSTTLRQQGITLEYTSNPAWVALQSLPYLMEYEHECAEQVFSRYYANAIAAHIINSNPKIAEVFAAWRKADKPVSKLEQNEELKSVILAESPWLLDAQSEEEKKNRLATLFELDKMKQNLEANLDKISKKQSASGAFPWFDGGKDNEYITRHILAGFGHLSKLGITTDNTINNITKKGIAYLDNEFLTEYEAFLKTHKKNEGFRIAYPYSALHYLYTRSFYLKQCPPNTLLSAAVKLYLVQIKMHWQEYSLYEKGMAALALNRFGEQATAKKIINGLKQTSALNEENGMYWIENKAGWYWYRAPIETQALLIEAFAEVTNDIESVDAMKVWLIKQKQNKNWPTTKSTSEAVYALLMQGTNWLSVKENTTFKLGDQKVFETKLAESAIEAGTGYIKLNWKPNEVTKDMATLTVENKSAVPGYGGLYWQYFEDLDKIKPAQDGIMNIAKELYLKKNTADGPQLQRVTTASPLQIGDLVTVRLILTIKEDVEYVHLKDMRASAFEPVDVLSKYEYHDGLGYYRSTRDAATHFFFDNINKGTYVLEYDVRVNNAGEFSNGITTLQSMYAPEFSGHTKCMRVETVENK